MGRMTAFLKRVVSRVRSRRTKLALAIRVTAAALASSFLVLPSRAHRQIRANAARLIELIAGAFSELLAGLTHGLDNDALHRIQDGIGAAVTALHAMGQEAERERAARLSSGPDTG